MAPACSAVFHALFEWRHIVTGLSKGTVQVEQVQATLWSPLHAGCVANKCRESAGMYWMFHFKTIQTGPDGVFICHYNSMFHHGQLRLVGYQRSHRWSCPQSQTGNYEEFMLSIMILLNVVSGNMRRFCVLLWSGWGTASSKRQKPRADPDSFIHRLRPEEWQHRRR